MSPNKSNAFTCFDGQRLVATGSLQDIALTLREVRLRGTVDPVLVFDNSTGRTLDIDTRGTDDEVLTHLAVSAACGETRSSAQAETSPAVHPDEPHSRESRGRGRPKLGVVPREVTLLPRHWEWLGAQPGGVSVALRKLVEDARRTGTERDGTRKARERAYHFMSAIAGDLPGFEEATRALFAHDSNRFGILMATWPADIRDHALFLGFGSEPGRAPANE